MPHGEPAKRVADAQARQRSQPSQGEGGQAFHRLQDVEESVADQKRARAALVRQGQPGFAGAKPLGAEDARPRREQSFHLDDVAQAAVALGLEARERRLRGDHDRFLGQRARNRASRAGDGEVVLCASNTRGVPTASTRANVPSSPSQVGLQISVPAVAQRHDEHADGPPYSVSIAARQISTATIQQRPAKPAREVAAVQAAAPVVRCWRRFANDLEELAPVFRRLPTKSMSEALTISSGPSL